MSSSPSRVPSSPQSAPRSSVGTGIVPNTDATLVLRDDGTIDHVSGRARRLLDLGARPVVGHSFFQHLPSTDVGRVARTVLALSPREDGYATGLLQLKTGLGPWQWFKVELTPRRRYEEKTGVVLRLHERGCPHRE